MAIPYKLYMRTIPDHVVAAYVARYPHLRHVAAWVPNRVPIQERAFADNCCNLAAPPGVTALEIWRLAGVATGAPWPAE